MKTSDNLKILRALHKGINPYTGATFKPGSPYQKAETVRALYAAINALECVEKGDVARGNRPGNSGAYWSPAEDKRLVKAFEKGTKVAQIAEMLQRTDWAVVSHLLKLDKLNI